jgi:hypothetical protein
MDAEKSSSKRHSRHKSKHEKHKDFNSDLKHGKRVRDDDEEKGSRKHHRKHKKSENGIERDRRGEHKMEIVDDDPNDEGMWIEKDISMDGERVRNSLLYSFYVNVSFLFILEGPCN